jgi:lysophospholipase L1-like esterase
VRSPRLSESALLTVDQLNDQRLSSPAALQGFFAALTQLENKRSPGPLRIIQIGDSHTANDAFSGRMREMMQTRFGSAGRGWLPAGIPFRYYQPRLVTVAEAGWRHLGVADGAPSAAIGIDANVAQSEHADAEMTLVSTEIEGFTHLAIEFLAQPHGGGISIRVDQDEPVWISTGASTICAIRRVIPITGRPHRVELRATDRHPVHLIGWTTEHSRAGIIYENHGTIGATVDLLGRMSPVTVAGELADSRPALIVIAFGTNEGFDGGLNLQTYRSRLFGHVDALRRKAAEAAILVLGPPDGNQLGDPSTANRSWHEPANLAAVRRAQHMIATDRGWAFWDWSQAMGGAGSMHRLVVRDPPLALPDHMHLNRFGYAATADVLFFDLINAYEKWKGCA